MVFRVESEARKGAEGGEGEEGGGRRESNGTVAYMQKWLSALLHVTATIYGPTVIH